MQDKKLNDSCDAEYQMDVSVRAVTDGDLNDELPMEVEQCQPQFVFNFKNSQHFIYLKNSFENNCCLLFKALID
ncbi:unnamed protein product [Euphydryas editha]|uniref:Uncharacterized protein n=1 Tax=Euphydryas editha TaxID=104508 RepID=A0AAU9V5Q6_EUPED|nr:unnamed protein product [Euphydryas editha]